jgi:hypothetical protein
MGAFLWPASSASGIVYVRLEPFISKRESIMNRRTTLTLSVTALLFVTASAAIAQNAPPTFQGDPDVYKVIFEDQNFRVIAATWKKGVHDKAHSHPVPSVIYALNDCLIRIHAPDGKTRDITDKAGTAMAVPITPSHTAENVGASDCQAIFVERK